MANRDRLRIFGCTAFPHVPKDERKKLNSKAAKCIFLGYGSETKGYRLYDPKQRRVFHSRDIIFHVFSNCSIEEPSATKQEEKHERLVEFDCYLEQPVQDEESKFVLRRRTCERKPPDKVLR